jgi:uncharacterized membrane protein YhaH (DUF805 family)
MNWYLDVLKKYAVFTGRARRKEYWCFFLITLIISIILAVIDGILTAGLLGGLYMLAVLIPGIAVSVRRLHDSGRSAWWLLIGLVPLLGGIILLVFMALDSTPGENQFGPNPKETTPVTT